MNYFKRIAMLIIAASLLFCLIGCAQIKIQSFEWQEQGEISFTLQPTYKDIRKSYSADTTKTDKATYYVEESLSQGSKNQVVTYFEQALDRLSITMPLNVYIYEDAGNGFVMETDGINAVHISPTASKMDIIIVSLQAIKSPYANYGLLYGMAAKLHNELGWGNIKTKSEKQIKSFVSQNTDFDFYDLNYPSFTEKYGYNTDMAKSIAVNFTDYVKSEFGEETLNKLIDLSAGLNFEFEHRYAIYMSEYLKSVGGKYAVFPPKEMIRYSQFTSDFPLRIHTVSCDYYLYRDYQDPTFDETGYYFEQNYSTFKNIFCEFETAYSIIRSDFEYDGNDRVTVIIDQNDNYLDILDIGGTMDPDGDNIRLRLIFAAVHEYAHSVAFRKYGFKRSWLTESLCDYYYMDIDIITKGIEQISIYGMYFTLLDTDPVIQKRKEYYLNYLAQNNLPFNEHDLVDAMAFIRDQGSPLNISKLSNATSFSFLLYIIDNYGIKSAIKLYNDPMAFNSILGKSTNELIADWQNYLQEKFEMISF